MGERGRVPRLDDNTFHVFAGKCHLGTGFGESYKGGENQQLDNISDSTHTIGRDCQWQHPRAPSVRWLWDERATEAVLECLGGTRVRVQGAGWEGKGG